MYRRPRSLRWRVGLGAALAAGAAMAMPAGAHAALPATAAAAVQTGGAAGGVKHAGQSTAIPSRPFTATLITGDRVTVTPLGGDRDRFAVKVHKAAGRERIPFSTHRTKGGLAVVPADALPLLAADRLDQRLFDVLLLRRLGYDDSTRTDLPLMSTGPKGRAAAPAAPRGARAVRSLPRLGVTVLRTEKRDTPQLWRSVAGTPGRAPTAAGKLWLVGKLRPNLDASVPQVGAPSAWAAGHTGRGVKVAVLDTGYDQQHPDLKGVVADAKDFTGSEHGVQDVIGHGTHVASTIAGRGAASNGKYTGVAKGAQLIAGKVCGDFGCPEDAILAGMDWAANSGAKVVNLSLGGDPTEGGDLLEEAVDYYTASAGTLFVIAAGNSGPQAETVSSPGTADAALTVGSVTKSDELSWFSSRGPRVSPSRRLDYAIKPEITAPGQDIVAARAEGTLDDVAVGKDYARLSGTSMATPHVAGAAAIVAGQHPQWTPAQIKAALTSTTKGLKGLTVYEQGAGRLDVGRAVSQSVHGTGVLSLGYFPWPNANAPTARKSVTYTNSGSAPVTLKLALIVVDDKKKPAPKGMFTTSASTVTVPAGATASVAVTVKPNAGPVGLYSGTLAAVSADGTTRLRTAIGAYKEPESYNLSVTTLNRDGGAAFSDVLIINRETGDTAFLAANGALLRRLPVGEYTVAAINYEFPPDDGEVGTIAEVRGVKLGKVNELVFDARRAKPLTVGVDRAGTVPQGGIDISVAQRGGGGLGVGASAGHVWAVPGSERIPGMEFGISTVLVKPGTGQPDLPPTPVTYNLTFPVAERIPAKLNFVVPASSLASVKQTISRQGADEARHLFAFGFNPLFPIASGYPTPLGSLRARTDYFTTSPGVRFSSGLISGEAVEGGSTLEGWTNSDLQSYVAGRSYAEKWNTAVFGPGFGGMEGVGPWRLGDQIVGAVPLLGDSQPGHTGYANDPATGTTALLRDGKVVAESTYPGFIEATVPGGKATYRLEVVLRRNVRWTQLSSSIEAAWTFRSGRVTGEQPASLPLLAVRYRPTLDADNRAPGSGAFSFPVLVEPPAGTPMAAVKTVTVQVSYDGGKTWTNAALTGTGSARTATVQHPGKPGYASLRATAVDSAGNRVEQTIINAYALK